MNYQNSNESRRSSKTKDDRRVPQFGPNKEAKNEFQLKLINYISRNTVVWDINHPDYHKSEKREQVFQRFADEFYPNSKIIDATSCAATWKSLRQSYTRSRLRIKNDLVGDLNCTDEKPWKYSNEMSFLENTIMFGNDPNSTVINRMNNDQLEDQNFTFQNKRNKKEQMSSNDAEFFEPFLETSLDTLKSCEIEKMNSIIEKQNIKIDKLMEMIAKSKDPNYHFAMNLMENLKEIKSKKKLALVTSKILSIVAESITDDEE